MEVSWNLQSHIYRFRGFDPLVQPSNEFIHPSDDDSNFEVSGYLVTQHNDDDDNGESLGNK